MTFDSDNAPTGSARVFDLDEVIPERPVIALCNMILSEGLAAKATAIRLVSTGDAWKVRYQVGDEWHDVMTIPTMAGGPLINRIRVMANLDRTQGHSRQEGVVHASSQGNPVVFNVEVEPKPDGTEDATLRCTP